MSEVPYTTDLRSLLTRELTRLKLFGQYDEISRAMFVLAWADALVPVFAAEIAKAQAEALEGFAEDFAERDGIEALMFARDDVAAVGIVEKMLLMRAAAIREGER